MESYCNKWFGDEKKVKQLGQDEAMDSRENQIHVHTNALISWLRKQI